MRKILLILIILLFASLASPAWAANYYVREDGSAAWDGTSDCSAAGNAMSPAVHNANIAQFTGGDTIYLCDENGPIDSPLALASGVNDGSRVVYDGYPEGACTARSATCAGRAALEANQSGSGGRAIALDGADYVTIQDLEIYDKGSGDMEGIQASSITGGAASSSTIGLSIFRTYIHDMQVRAFIAGDLTDLIIGGSDANGNRMSNNGRSGACYGQSSCSGGASIAIAGNVTNATVSYNDLHGDGISKGRDGVVGACANTGSGFVIEYNKIYDHYDTRNADADGIDIKNCDGVIIRKNYVNNNKNVNIRLQYGSDEGLIQNNWVGNAGQHGISINTRYDSSQTNSYIIGNVIMKSGWSGIGISENGGFSISGVYIYGNTIAKNGINPYSTQNTGVTSGSDVPNTVIKNNIFYQNRYNQGSNANRQVYIGSEALLLLVT
ncbi:MAG: right-handed parallel beta-helix repeat-containing protein [Candidatus Thorarchaeota archaeon]|jgi:hypothetical protein